MLTREQKVVRSYWPYMLDMCEGLFLDVANLNAKSVDSKQFERFRAKWSGRFRAWVDEDDVLLVLRNMIHGALEKGDLGALAVELANFPALSGSTHASLELAYRETGDPAALFPRPKSDGFYESLAAFISVNRKKFPIFFDMPRALSAAILSFTGKGLTLVRCRQCEHCGIGRSNQRFCPGGACRRAWHQSQPANKEKRRKYMREKMREYRAEETEEDAQWWKKQGAEQYRKATGKKNRSRHAKAT